VDEFSTPWFGILGQEGFTTGDGRHLAPGSTDLEALPLPLPFSAVLGPDQSHGHAGAYVVGTIDGMRRVPNPDMEGVTDVWGWGRFTGMAGMFAAEMAFQATSDGRRGYDVSFDLDRASYEIRMSADQAAKTLEEIQEFMKMFEGDFKPPTEPEDLGEVNADGSVTIYEEKAGGYYAYITGSEVRSATMVRIGAMAHGWVALGAPPLFVEAPAETEEMTLAAAGSAWAPKSAWFDDPRLTGPTPMTITDDGRIFGHLALHASCHTAYAGRCVSPPRSSTEYTRFHKGSVLTAEGNTRAVGSIVMGGEHAPLHMTAPEVIKYHADASLAVAAVRAGEDSYGIWLSGALLPDVTDEQIARLRSLAWSGHWNRKELTIVLAVNSPGFTVPVEDRVAARALAASGVQEPLTLISEPWYSPEEALVAGCGCSCGTTDTAAEPVEATVEEPVEETTEDLAADPTETDSTPGSGSDPTDDPEALAQLAALRNLMGV
jgi:hypothetical protein